MSYSLKGEKGNREGEEGTVKESGCESGVGRGRERVRDGDSERGGAGGTERGTE